MSNLSLWPEGKVPYSEYSPMQAAPSMEGFPVQGSRGAVVVVPGGGYVHKAAHEGAPIAHMLNEGGVSAYVLDYRVQPCHYLAPVSDALKAIEVVRGLGYEKVAILGFSAGGHVACSAATLYGRFAERPEAARPDDLVACYPVASFVRWRHQGSVEALLSDRCTDPELLRLFSAELQVNANTPPAFFWHTSEDAAVPVQNTLNLASAYANAGVPFEAHIYPHGRHGLGLAEETQDAREWTDALKRYLKLRGYGA